MNRVMRGRLLPLLDDTGKCPANFPGDAAAFWQLPGALRVLLPIVTVHFLVVDTGCPRFADDGVHALLQGYGLTGAAASEDARGFLAAFIGVPAI